MERLVQIYSKNIAEACDFPVVGFFIYGSVAKNSHTAKSDIDSFLITKEKISERIRNKILRKAIESQRSLGFLPDEKYPIEIFSVLECEKAFDEFVETVQGQKELDNSSDLVEICRSFLVPKMIVHGAEAITSFELKMIEKLRDLRTIDSSLEMKAKQILLI
jgi:predicted nucleotidyltransferase